jgi:hypothetical protein
VGVHRQGRNRRRDVPLPPRRFLRESGQLQGDPVLLTLADHYDQLSRTWVALADCAKRGAHADGLTLARTVRELEHRGVELTQHYLEAVL